MKLFVLDASVAVKWFVSEEHSDVAALLLDENFDLAVPRLFFSEFGNILWKKFSRGELSHGEVIDAARGLPSAMLTPMDDEWLLDVPLSWRANSSIRSMIACTSLWPILWKRLW